MLCRREERPRDADGLLCVTNLKTHIDERVLVGLKRDAIAHAFLEGGHLDNDLIGAGLQEWDDILAGAISLRPVDGAGTGLRDGHLSVLDDGPVESVTVPEIVPRNS